MGHLNINSLAGKFDQLKLLIGKNIDILIITETQNDSSFSNAQFIIKGFSISFRLGLWSPYLRSRRYTF